MTRTVQIEKLIELLSSIAGKFAANPTMSHLVTDGVEAVNADGLILKLDDCAKKTAVKSFEADFMAYQDETPTLENPQGVNVWTAQDGFKFFMYDSDNNHESYLIPLKYVSIDGVRYETAGGHINVITGVATITHIKETLTPGDEWHKSNTYDGSFYVTRNIKKSNANFLSKYSECVAIDDYAYGYCAASSKNLNFWYAAEGTTTDEFKEWLSTNPIEIAYELASPVQVQLDPVTIKTLNDTTCYIQTYQGCITHVAGEYIRDVAAVIEAIEDTPTVEINKEGVTPSENAETITIDTDTYAVNGVEINKTGVEPTETLTTLTQGDTSYSIGGGFTPTPLTLTLPAQQASGGDIPVIEDMSAFDWIMVEVSKPSETMAGYSGSFNGIVWIPTDRMGSGETGTTETELGASFNFTNPTSGAVTVQGMLSIKDAHNLHWVYASSLVVRRAWGI